MQNSEFSPCFAGCPEGTLPAFKGGGGKKKKNPEGLSVFVTGKTSILDFAVCEFATALHHKP